jgi:deoxyadenosine/deoxycytidine kinase
MLLKRLRWMPFDRVNTKPESGRPQPFLVEVTGVAGAGKSTLVTTLCEGTDGYVKAEFLHSRKPDHLLRVARSVPQLLRLLAANLFRPPRLSWADFKLMAYVAEWHRFLKRRQEYSTGVTVLDQGPIYALVRLKARNRGIAASPYFRRWWEAKLELWADTLSAIVWLDAPDGLLQSRIDGRSQDHVVKGEPVEVGRQFISQYRALFDQTLRKIDVHGGPELLRFETSEKSPELIASELSSMLPVRSKR